MAVCVMQYGSNQNLFGGCEKGTSKPFAGMMFEQCNLRGVDGMLQGSGLGGGRIWSMAGMFHNSFTAPMGIIMGPFVGSFDPML